MIQNRMMLCVGLALLSMGAGCQEPACGDVDWGENGPTNLQVGLDGDGELAATWEGPQVEHMSIVDVQAEDNTGGLNWFVSPCQGDLHQTNCVPSPAVYDTTYASDENPVSAEPLLKDVEYTWTLAWLRSEGSSQACIVEKTFTLDEDYTP